MTKKTWYDYNLKWNPAEYGNISTIRISSTRIWIPGKRLRSNRLNVYINQLNYIFD